MKESEALIAAGALESTDTAARGLEAETSPLGSHCAQHV